MGKRLKECELREIMDMFCVSPVSISMENYVCGNIGLPLEIMCVFNKSESVCVC